MKAVTGQDMYDLFHDMINKEENGSITIPEFESIINEHAIIYLTDRADEYERTQKRIDDLRSLKRYEYLVPTNAPENEFDFENASVIQSGGVLVDETETAGRFGYFRTTRVEVEWCYKDNPCFPDGVSSVGDQSTGCDLSGGSTVDERDLVKWVRATPMKSDKDLRGDYYNEPTDERPYYDFLSDASSGTILKIINDTKSRANRVRLEYLVYPADIVVDTVTPIDFPIHSRREICSLASITFLERIESQRVKSAVAVKGLTSE